MGIKTKKSGEEIFQKIAKNIDLKIFKQYRSDKEHHREKEKSRKSKSVTSSKSAYTNWFSLKEILEIPQNDLSQMVFTFNEKHIDLLDSSDEFSEIQDILKNCALFKDFET